MKRITLSGLIFLFFTSILVSQELPRIAVIPFDAVSVSRNDASIATMLFETSLVNTEKYTVVEQSNVEKILDAQSLALTGVVDEETAIQIGRLLAAEQIVLGSMAKIGEEYIINAKMIDVQSGQNIRAERIRFTQINEIGEAAEHLARIFAGLEERQLARLGEVEKRRPLTNKERSDYDNLMIVVTDQFPGKKYNLPATISPYIDNVLNRRWSALQGQKKLDYAEFFHLAGYSEEAALEESNIKTMRIWRIAGVVTSVISLGLFNSAMSSDQESSGMIITSALAAIAGPSMFISSFIINPKTPIGTARDAANEYNEKLLNSYYK